MNNEALTEYKKALALHMAKKAAGQRTVYPYSKQRAAMREFMAARGEKVTTKENIAAFEAL